MEETERERERETKVNEIERESRLIKIEEMGREAHRGHVFSGLDQMPPYK